MNRQILRDKHNDKLNLYRGGEYSKKSRAPSFEKNHKKNKKITKKNKKSQKLLRKKSLK